MQTSLFDLSGKTAVVTGASGGLGSQFVETLIGAGAQVIATGRNVNHENLLALRQRHGAACISLAVDVTIDSSIDEFYTELAERELAVDVLVNNAGIALADPAIDVPVDSFDDVMATNLRGPWLMAQGFARAAVAAKRPGNLINIASILGSRVSSATMPYATAKAGIVQMSKALALEWARYQIRVNSLSPGYIETEMTRAFLQSQAGSDQLKRVPQRRAGMPSDLAGVLLLLASDASAYMTGSDVVVDGGHLCSSL